VTRLTTVFDADNHYWESSDAFTRHRSPLFADRGVLVREVDGKMRYLVQGEQHPWIPGPGDSNPRPRPGALLDYFAGRDTGQSIAESLTSEDPTEHPEWFNRDARLACMDDQEVEACWMFPSQGVCMEGLMQPDIEAIVDIFGAFNRWIDDEWGFAYHNRIFGVPQLTLSDLDAAEAELEWVIDRGARVIGLRQGPVFTDSGWKSPADPIFDPFWARVAEAHLVLTLHPGFDEGYRDVEDAVARSWGYAGRRRQGDVASLQFFEPVVEAVMSYRLIHDFMVTVVAHGLFTRHPGLRFASVENGAEWVPSVLRALKQLHSRSPEMFGPELVDQFREHVWVAPFGQDDVAVLADHIPVERILFGSDWPHAEGWAEPKGFMEKLEGFSARDQQLIMRENARTLTQGA
jgi:predicted TIM-barrel fold metal-dependent hydrolase